MTLREYLRVLRDRWRTVVAGLLLGVAVAFAVVALIPREYAADMTMFVSGVADDASSALDSSQVSTQRMATYAEVLESDKILNEVGMLLQPPVPGGDLAGRVTARAQPETVLLRVTVRDSSAERATEIANLLGVRFVETIAELELYPDRASQQVVTARVFEPATLPQQPESPGLVFTLGLGVLLGIVLGSGGALAGNAADSSIRSAGALRTIADARVLGVVDSSVDLLAQPTPTLEPTPGHESVRRLRANLQSAELQHDRRAILVVGAAPGAATTTMLVNLAVTIAAGGRRVLVVDADLRHGAVTEHLGLECCTGLAEVLSTGSSWPKLALRWANDQVFVLPCGALPTDGTDLLLRPQLAELIADARRRYDVVLVAAPPIGPMVDAVEIAPQVDGVLLAVHRGRTTRLQVEGAVAMLHDVSARIAGTVLTEGHPAARRHPEKGEFHPQPEEETAQVPMSSSPPRPPSPRPRGGERSPDDGNGHAEYPVVLMT